MTANSTPEPFDAVVAEMRDELEDSRHVVEVSVEAFRDWIDRLQSAHARELAEQQSQLNHVHSLCNSYRDRIAELEAAYLHYRPLAERADAAMGLLREVVVRCEGYERHPRMTNYWRPAFATIRNIAQQALAGRERKE